MSADTSVMLGLAAIHSFPLLRLVWLQISIKPEAPINRVDEAGGIATHLFNATLSYLFVFYLYLDSRDCVGSGCLTGLHLIPSTLLHVGAIIYAERCLAPCGQVTMRPNPAVIERHLATEPLDPSDSLRLEEMSLVLAQYCTGPAARGKYDSSYGKLKIVYTLLSERHLYDWTRDEIDSMGILVGEALVQDGKLEWAVAIRDGKREPVVRVPGTAIAVHAARLIHEHFAPGKTPDLFDVFNALLAEISAMKEGRSLDQTIY